MEGLSAAGAREHLADALRSVGLENEAGDGTVLIVRHGAERIAIEVEAASLITAKDVSRLVRRATEEGEQRPRPRVLVAKRITEDARRSLREAGYSWLDLRGRLHLAAPGLFVHADVEPVLTTRRAEPFAGAVVVEVAVTALLAPERPVRIRHIAQSIGRAPSSVSVAVDGLRRAGLLTSDGVPDVPGLFWELAAAWRPEELDIAELPLDDLGLRQALRMNDADVSVAGWALSDSHAAAAYGAPIAIRADSPPDFYVPDSAVLRRAAKLLGTTNRGRGDRAATLRVSPVGYVCRHRVAPQAGEWPLAHPLFVALDLAGDPGRGREIVELWTPEGEFRRVW
ncbi:hypothetical protein [Nocardia sp. NPDC057353]|uniref:hypothetical protein n=1 Tax=Nocardia sp. NPDC057353 TaxID=3346104 RepID=UPI003644F832